MKTKEMKKKLSLNKVTVAHLGRDEMNEVKGGDPPTFLFSIIFPCETYECETDNGCVRKKPSNPCQTR